MRVTLDWEITPGRCAICDAPTHPYSARGESTRAKTCTSPECKREKNRQYCQARRDALKGAP